MTKTDSKGRELKMGVITKLREALDEHKSLYVFSFDNMRSAKFKDVRIDWRDSRSVSRDDSDGLIPIVTHQTAWGKARHQPWIASTYPMMSISLLFLPMFMGDPRFFLGKNKVMQKAFGVTPEDEFRDNLRHLAKVEPQLLLSLWPTGWVPGLTCLGAVW